MAQHSGAMIAFMLSEPDASALLAQLPVDVQPEGDLHLTLAFLGDASGISPEAVLLAIAALQRLVFDAQPLTGLVSGLGRFTAVPDGETPLYASFDAPGLPDFRSRVISALANIAPADETHGFTPHITLAYLPKDTPTPVMSVPAVQLSFNSISLVLAGARIDIPFGPVPTITPVDAGKAGARHSASDQADMQALHDIAVRQGALCESNALKAISTNDDEIRVGNYIMLFGGRDLEGVGSKRRNPDGSRGEFFTKSTVHESEYTRRGMLPIDWEHGRAKHVDGLGRDDVIGYVDWKTARVDEKGVFVERVLNRYRKYLQFLDRLKRSGMIDAKAKPLTEAQHTMYVDSIYELIQAGVVGNSSEAIPELVVRGDDGELKIWPLRRDTFTVQPMEPRMVTTNVVTALKALGFEPSPDDAVKPKAEATGAHSAATAAKSIPQGTPPINPSQQEILEMDPKELEDKIAAGVKSAFEAQSLAAQAETDRKAKEDERIATAVAAEKAKWEKDAAKSRRLPDDGQAPHQAQFGETRKYDNLTAADTAFLIDMLAKSPRRRQIPEAAAKALMIKVAENKEVEGVIGRDAAKSIGLDPADALDAAKANELNYTTQAGFGDEFVPTIWSSSVWKQIRYGANLVAKIPQQMFTGPGDTFTIPIEGADPTWYRVGQAKDLNATTGRPDATIGDSKIATANNSIGLGDGQKMATRVPYTGEMEEDSIIPWVAQAREQTETSFKEQLEHVVIDGDTATGATTNINHIGGTPTSTGTKQDLFLLLNGFRKSPLVTTTSNSRSAAGGLLDTDFIQILQLLGPAGLNADPDKVDFIIDANVYWKVQQLVSVKTRDVFLAATLENGMFNGIWGYKVWRSPFMHWRSTTNPRKANTAGKVDLTTQGNNTTGSILAVRWDQWLLGYKRNITMTLQSIPDSDAYQLIATARVNMIQRDTEGSAIAYNVGV